MTTIYKYLIVSVCLIIIGCKTDQEVVSEEIATEKTSQITITKKQFEASKMVLGRLQQKEFDKKITVNGKIHLPLKNKAIVSSLINGTIGAFDFVEGQWINKGQTLFTVTNPELIDLQEGYLVLKSKLAYLNEEVKRKEELVSENLTAKKDLLLAKSEYETGLTNYRSIEKKLRLYGIALDSLTNIRLRSSISIFSPISGYISKIDVLRGQFISPSTELMTIDNRSHVHLEINILERDAFYIIKGQKISFSLQGMPNKQFEAEVHLMDPSVSDNGMVNVHCHIKGDASKFLPGMYATADIILESYMASAVEEEAILQIEGTDHILVEQSSNDEEMKFDPISVKKGMTKDGFVELMNVPNLQNEQILVKGGYYLTN